LIAVAVAAFGGVLCLLWLGMHVSGWKLFNRLFAQAIGFSWDSLPRDINPMIAAWEWRGNTQGGFLYIAGNLVIWLFILFYVCIGVYYFGQIKTQHNNTAILL
jgi:hypothetical protein